MSNLNKTHRQKALEWWNSLRSANINGIKGKKHYTDNFFGFNMRIHKYLTGREIEQIWRTVKN